MSIQVNGVSVYQNGNPDQRILDSIQCELTQRSITLLVGHTGAGKSTLLDVMTGMIPPNEGEVLYDQSAIWKKRSNRKKVRLQPGVCLRNGIVFQFPEQQLFAKDIQAEFTYSLRPYHVSKVEIRARSISALHQMGLQEQLLAQSPFTLSVGQKRRVVLANVFATDAKWLFLDEPTSGLDPTATAAFIHHLLDWKQQVNGSLVIATHDLDTFLQIANQVIVLNQGRLIDVCTPKEFLCKSKRIEEVTIGLPQQLKTQIELERCGFRFPDDYLQPEEMANMIFEQIQNPIRKCRNSSSQKIETVEFSKGMMEQTAVTGVLHNEYPIHDANTRISDTSKWRNLPFLIRQLDPRAKWVFYIMMSVGILLQHTWTGMVSSSILSLFVVHLCGESIWGLWKSGKSFYLFVLLSAVISGLQFGGKHPIRISIPSAVVTFQHLYPVVLVMWLGLLLPFTTSQNEMKKGIEASLSHLSWTKLPVEAFALGTSLLFRFVPMIKRDVERFSKIMQTRGKKNLKPGTIRLRDLHVVLIPLVISLIQHAEAVAIAMEVRGYKRTGQKRTSSLQFKFTKQDWLTVMIAILIVGLLTFLRNVTFCPFS